MSVGGFVQAEGVCAVVDMVYGYCLVSLAEAEKNVSQRDVGEAE